MDNEKVQMLVSVAKMYYEDNLNQSAVAKVLGVSRPLVSKYLADAKDLGIVEIKIHSPFESDDVILDTICERYGIKGGNLIKGVNSNSMTEKMIVKSSYEFLLDTLKDGDCVGMSWGNMIGAVVKKTEQLEFDVKLNGDVCSLVGNSATANKNYHTDELCRAFSQATGLTPNFILAPAFYENSEELENIRSFELYQGIQKKWEKINFAIVNIENHPSVPDLATASRFGEKIKTAVGHMVSYYYDEDGNVINNDSDLVYRISMDQLKKADVVMGVCRCNTTTKNLIGALKCGIITHIFVDQKIAEEVVKQG